MPVHRPQDFLHSAPMYSSQQWDLARSGQLVKVSVQSAELVAGAAVVVVVTGALVVAELEPLAQLTVTMVPPMPHILTPLLTRMYPFSPQLEPQEFLTSQ